jgi:hypothetical protein
MSAGASILLARALICSVAVALACAGVAGGAGAPRHTPPPPPPPAAPPPGPAATSARPLP